MIWLLGSVIVWRVGRLHISAAYVASFCRARVRAQRASPAMPWQAALAPITGPMYQLFIFFMVTDPKTTVAAEMGASRRRHHRRDRGDALRLSEIVYAPFYALFLVGPVALLVEQAGVASAIAGAELALASLEAVRRASGSWHAGLQRSARST